VRNPLFAIQSALAVMRSRRDVQSGQHARAVVERQITHITRLIDDLMDTARVERGSLSLERNTLDLREAIRTAVEAAEPFFKERGHDFVPQLSHEPLWVSGDRVRLQQVFSNLLLNAAKYTPVGGRIELVASRTYSEICVVVRDSGRGIQSDHLDQIFEPFVRGARDAQGLGMGLYVARTLVEQHGGRITAESPGPDRGATFTVCLPELSPLLRRAV
jgi:signal transduction histidine kinase